MNAPHQTHNDEPMHPAQIAALRRMTPQKKLEVMAQIISTARQSKEIHLRRQHPGWTEAQVADALRRHMLHGAA